MDVTYYPIDEAAARRAKEANSFFDYHEGEATASYRAEVDAAAKLAEKQKELVDPIYHEKIDRLLDTYARKLAENRNNRYRIDARVPSILVAGGSNFPVRKKEKQNSARDANLQEWREIQGLLDKIRGTGKGGISADDPNAANRLNEKLTRLRQELEAMKAVNAWYRKHRTLEGCPGLTQEQIQELNTSIARSWRADPKPFENYMLSNKNAAIRQTTKRIAELTKVAETDFTGWTFEGGRAEINRAENRLQLFFDGKPDEDVRRELRSYGFRWAPSMGAWQRQLSGHVFSVADKIAAIRPLSGKLPSQLQNGRPRQEESGQEAAEKASRPVNWRVYIIADLKTWSANETPRSPLEVFATFEEAKARFEELRVEPYNSEPAPLNGEGQPFARLTLGLTSSDGMSAADILQVRAGKNYLVDDFTRMDRLRNDPEVLALLSRTAREIGFDRVKGYTRTEEGYVPAPDVEFLFWDNPYFECETEGRIAAVCYDLMCEASPEYAEAHGDRANEICQLMHELSCFGCGRIALELIGLKNTEGLPEPVREKLPHVIRELSRYKAEVGALRTRPKEKVPSPRER